MTTPTKVTVNDAFEEEEEHDGLGTITAPSSTVHDGPAQLNNQGYKNGSTPYKNRNSGKPGGVFSRISKATLFRVFLLLLILALVIPILVLVALIYQQSGSYRAADYAGSSRVVGNLNANPAAIPSESGGAANAKNDEEYYKKEPWLRDSAGAWKQLGTTLTETVDPRSDPCSDFFAYSCDQWRDRHPLNGRQEISEETKSYEAVKNHILGTFASLTPSDPWPTSVRWAKSFYDKCTAIDEAESAERQKSVVDFLSNTFASRAPTTITATTTVATSTAATTLAVISVLVNGSAPEPLVSVNGTSATVNISESVVSRHVRRAAEENVHGTSGQETSPHIANSTLRNHSEVGLTNVLATPATPNLTVGTNATIVLQENARVPNSELPGNTTTMAPTTTIPPVIIHEPVSAEVKPPPTESDIWSLAAAVSEAGVVTFFDMDFSKNPKDPSDLKTILQPPNLSLPSRRYYLEPYLSTKNFPVLEKSIIDTVKSLQSTPASTRALFPADSATANNIIRFETALARASPSASPTSFEDDVFDFGELRIRIPGARSYSLSGLESRWPRINWDAFLPEESKKTENRSDANQTASFIVTDPAYVDQLVGLLEDYDGQTVVNFLKWRYIFALSDYLTPSENLNATCYNALEQNAPLVLAHILYKSNYGLSPEEKSKLIYTPEAIQLLFNRTVQAFKLVLEFSGQIDNATKAAINDQFANQRVTTEWPDFVKDGTKLDSIYTNTVPNPQNSSFIDTLSNLLASDFVDDNVNAWSNAVPFAFTSVQYIGGNTISTVYDPRILNPQFSQSAVGQFATVGWQLARALVDSVHYFPKAPLRSSRIDQCLINQYNQFCYQAPINSCVDGSWTAEENFPDTVALQVAYRAYKTWESVMATSGVSDAFPAFLAASNLARFTLDQIFLISYGSSFCNNAENKYVNDWLASWQIAPDADRLRGSTANLNEFQLAFHCKAGDRMYRNPRERCQL